MSKRSPKRTQCPACGEMTVLPITYGLPDDELMEDSSRGTAIIGGCIIWEGQAENACTNCDWNDETIPLEFEDR